MITYQYCSCGRIIPEIFRWLAKKYHFRGICSNINNENTNTDNGMQHVYHMGITDVCDFFFPCGYGTIQQQLLKLLKKYKEGGLLTPYRWIGGILGTDKVVSKNGLWLNCMRYYISRAEMEEWLPPTYLLSSNRDKIEFMARCRASNKKFILKKNIQRKEGICLHLSADFTDADWDKYSNEGYVVVQELLENVALVRGRKVNLRVYMLVTARKGKIRVYYHQIGKCLYAARLLTNAEDDRDSDQDPDPDKIMKQRITSYKWDTTMEEMDKFYEEMPHSWEDLVAYAGNLGINKKIIRIIKRLKRVIRTVCETPDEWWRIMQFQLFGLDFIFDAEWNPHLLEINKGPDMEYKCHKDIVAKRRVYEDVYRTVGIIPSLEESLFVEI